MAARTPVMTGQRFYTVRTTEQLTKDAIARMRDMTLLQTDHLGVVGWKQRCNDLVRHGVDIIVHRGGGHAW